MKSIFYNLKLKPAGVKGGSNAVNCQLKGAMALYNPVNNILMMCGKR